MFDEKSIKERTLWVLLLVPVALFWGSVCLFAPDAPWWDDFPAILQYLSYPFPERLSHLADFHNEHRLIFPRLIFEAFEWIGGEKGFPFFWCTVFGDCLLLAYVFLLACQFKRRIGLWPFVPFVWIFLDLANCENTIWTLTAVQSHSVLLFALAAFVAFSRRESWQMLVLAMSCAVMSSLSSASGLGVWPALMIVALLDGRGRSAAWIVALCALAVGVPYMMGFAEAHGNHAVNEVLSLSRAVNFALCFMGNLCPLRLVALALGALSTTASVYLLLNFKKLKAEPVFGFFLYLLSIVAAGVCARSGMGDPGLASRFEVIAISLFCSEVYLMGCLFCGHGRLGRAFSVFVRCAIPCAVLANLAMPFVASGMLSERKAKIEYGYRVWPKRRDALVFWDPPLGDRVLQAYVERKKAGK